MVDYDAFSRRHIGPSEDQAQTMLMELGYSSMADFIADVVPQNIAITQKLSETLPTALNEVDVIAELRALADKNEVYRNVIGTGYYGTITPPVIVRNVLENPAWYTAYTPYQPEISQGRLEALFAFQTAVCDLTALSIANASMLDEGTAAAEAMTLARRVYKGSDDAVFLIDINVHPQTIAVVQTRAKPQGIKIEIVDLAKAPTGAEVFGALVQYPNTHGEIIDYSQLATWVHSKEGLLIAATDLLALTLLKAPGEWGADIAVGSAQRFGVPMGFGGPHAGFMSVREGLERSLPGRLIGQSVDAHGNPAFRLALQTREQHIRRDKATSNICTAQVLLAVMSAFYAMWHGPAGLKIIASRVNRQTQELAKSVTASGHKVVYTHYFDTLLIEVKNSAELHKRAEAKKINLKIVDGTHVGVSLDETTDAKMLADLCEIFGSGAA